MKLPLRIVPGYPKGTALYIVDDENRVVCRMPEQDMVFAETIVRKLGRIPWWRRWRRDERQKAYDKWLGGQNEIKPA